MRSRLALGTALLALPFLAACGGTGSAGADSDPAASASARATTGAPSVTSTPTSAPTGEASSSAPARTGPVLTGDVYTITLPKRAKIDESSPDWSRAWGLDLDIGGFGLDGQAMELSCANCPPNNAKSRARLAHRAVRGQGEVLPDVTINGVTLFHATKGRDGFRSDYYGAFTGGQQFQLVFTSSHPYKETGPIIAATLATLQLKV